MSEVDAYGAKMLKFQQLGPPHASRSRELTDESPVESDVLEHQALLKAVVERLEEE